MKTEIPSKPLEADPKMAKAYSPGQARETGGVLGILLKWGFCSEGAASPLGMRFVSFRTAFPLSIRHVAIESPLSPAFTLIELLVVIAIFAIMATLTLPAITSIGQASGINRAGELLGDQIVLARQEAASKNRDVEVRVIHVNDPLWPGYRALQLWQVDETGSNATPLGRIQKLPDSIVIASNVLSPLLTTDTSVSGTTNFGGLGTLPYKGFRVRSSGSLASAVTTNNNFLTVQLAKDSGIPPKNYYTVRVNPITGRVTIHRP